MQFQRIVNKQSIYWGGEGGRLGSEQQEQKILNIVFMSAIGRYEGFRCKALFKLTSLKPVWCAANCTKWTVAMALGIACLTEEHPYAMGTFYENLTQIFQTTLLRRIEVRQEANVSCFDCPQSSESLHSFRQFVQGHPRQSNVISLFMFMQTALGMKEWMGPLARFPKMALKMQFCNAI